MGLDASLERLPEFHLYGGTALGGTWFFTAFEATPRGNLAEFGAGCSHDPLHALKRAVTELAQCLGLVAETGLKEDERAMRLFAELPGLTPLKTLTPPDPKATEYSLDEIIGIGTDGLNQASPEEMFHQTQKALTDEGREVLFDVSGVTNEAYVSRVYVPGLERFHLIRVGSQVAPNLALL